MAQNEDIRIIWKTNCKWRDTDYYVKQEDVRPIGSCKDKIKEGDAVKVKYGTRWYNAEIVEITTSATTTTTTTTTKNEVDQVVDEVADDDHYQKFLALQGKRERDWKVGRELARKKKKENRQDDVASTSASAAPCNGNGSIQPVTADIGVEAMAKEWVSIKKRIDEIDKKAAFAADLTKMIQQIKCSVTENFSAIEKRLESLEIITKSPETVTMIEEMSSSIKSYLFRIEQRLETMEFSTKSTESQFNSPIDDSYVSIAKEDSPPLNSSSLASTGSSNQFQLSTIDFDTLRRLVENPTCTDNINQTTEVESGKTSSTLPDLANSEASSSQLLSDDVIRKFVTPSKDVKKISAILESTVEPRKCALKLLSFFFSEQELRQCNTDGTHGKPALDPVKLNSLKVLLFMRFVLKCKEDEEDVWKGVKTAINSKCRANIKFYKKRLNLTNIPQE